VSQIILGVPYKYKFIIEGETTIPTQMLVNKFMTELTLSPSLFKLVSDMGLALDEPQIGDGVVKL